MRRSGVLTCRAERSAAGEWPADRVSHETTMKSNDSGLKKSIGREEQPLTEPPTAIGSTFRITDLGTDDGGVAISAIADAFEDCFGDKALVVENEHGASEVYSFDGRSPIYCCHVPDDAYEPAVHGEQTMGFRYSYRFMRDIGTGNEIEVVDFGDTKLTEVAGVLYP